MCLCYREPTEKLCDEELELRNDAAGFDDLLESISSPANIQCSKKRRKRRKTVQSVAMPDYIRTNPDMRKYWAQRYRIFSKFDSGVKLDEGRYIAEKMFENFVQYIDVMMTFPMLTR